MLSDNTFDSYTHSVLHLGACSSTTEMNADYLAYNNYTYSIELAKYCLKRGIRFVYASSAATYGDGANGYDDTEEGLDNLRPLNMYGYSKHMFDLWARNLNILDKIAGLKFFNVYGPNEYHKGEMRSVVHKAFEQVREKGKVQLFKSYRDGIADGEQKRDFIYVKDVVEMALFFLDNPDKNGLFNIGSGNARTWNDLVKSLFQSVGKPVNIEYIDMPEEIKSKYQYFTEANLTKIKSSGYSTEPKSLEEGISDYVKNYLQKKEYSGTVRYLVL